MSWQETNQQAIQNYLEDLLRDELDTDTLEAAEEATQLEAAATTAEAETAAPETYKTKYSFNEQEESIQEQELKSVMHQQQGAYQAYDQPEIQLETQPQASSTPNLSFKEASSVPEVILPNINLPQPKLETLADMLEEMEKKQKALLEAKAKEEAEMATQQAVEVAEPEVTVAQAEPEVELEPEIPEAETQIAAKPEIATELEVESPPEIQAQVEIETVPEVAEPEPMPEIEPLAAEPEAQTSAIEAPVETQIEVASPDEPPLPPSWKNGRPAWAQERFECLLFKVKGLTLAVPLVELGGIIKIDDEPTPLFGQPSWFIGLLRTNELNVAVVDTAQWVLPPNLVAQRPEKYELVIRIHNSHWGLACNHVDKSISLESHQVRWRSSLTKRPWLAGTVIDHMCALIDAAAFARLLRDGHGELEPANLSSLKKGLAEI